MEGLHHIEGYRRKWGVPDNRLLTSREGQILRLVAEGKGNQEIGESLGISILTVKVHLTNIFDKLGVNRRNDAAAAFASRDQHLKAMAS